MTFLSSPDENHCNDGLLDVDAKVDTILLHMISLLDDSIQRLDATLHDELVYDANLDALLLANSNDAIHDVVRDPNTHDEVNHDAILLLSVLSNDDPTLLMGCPRDTLDEVAQRCCRQSDVEVHDEHLMLIWSLLDSHSRCHTRCVMSAPHL